VARIVISDLKENTFFASIIIEREGQVLSIDARPSDSVALALRARAPIYANDELLQQPPREPAASDSSSEEGEEEDVEPKRELTEEEKAEQLRRFIEKLNPEDFGKFQL
jgi:bifunctional DNase/RNase